MSAESLFLIDGPALFYRAYFAFIRNPLFNSKGENTSATFGFLNSLMKIIREENPDYMAVAFDTKAPTFRHRMYDEYKSTRAKMPEELILQLPRIREATEALNLPALELEGYEADDIIGTLARAGEKKGMNVWIVSGDKDMFQLVSDNVMIYNPQKGSAPAERLDASGVSRKFGVPPEMVVDALSLMGDSSDNVPGVPGIGPKTAQSLLKKYGSLDKILHDVEKLEPKGARRKISENVDKALLSRKLVTIETAVPIEFDLKSLKRGALDFEKAKKLFLELEFSALLDELARQAGITEGNTVPEEKSGDSTAKAEYICINSLEELNEVVDSLVSYEEVAVDTETTSIDALRADLVGVSLCAEAGRAFYVPLGHDETDRNLPLDEALKILSRLLTSGEVRKIGQNAKYDLEVFHRAGLDMRPLFFDTMLASYVINPSGRQHSLSVLALEYFDYRMMPITDLIGKGKKQKSFSTVPVDKATFYAAEDADYTYRLRQALAPKIDAKKLGKLYYDIEVPLIEVLAAMEEAGVRIDPAYLAEMSGELEGQLERISRGIFDEAGHEFNINSTRQLSQILFEELHLPTKGKTAKKTGYATDIRVLEELAKIHDLPRLVLDYRQLMKLKNTYVDALPKLINESSGRVHTSFNQTIAATGRLSSTDPNLQNIPVRTEIGRRIRRAFIPRDERHRLLVADYSQVELRILAHFSEDKKLIEAFENGEDIHARTAAEVYGVDIGEVTPEMRRAAKTANFAVIYGVSAYGLSMQTEMDVTQSKEFIETYFARYPGIKKYMDDTIDFARQNGHVVTLHGRIRYLPEINSKNYQVRQFAERTAINTPIQGTAADMIKVAMIGIHKRMKKIKSRLILQVHDELIFDAHVDELEDLKKIVRTGMEEAVGLAVPVVVDMGVGENWLDAKK